MNSEYTKPEKSTEPSTSSKNKNRPDLLSYIRNGIPLTARQKLRLVITLSIPGIIAQITSVIMQYIDASMVGHLGADASAAIGLVTTTIWLFGGICYSVCAGFYIQTAQYIGAKEYEKARTVLKQSLFFVLLFSLLLVLIGLSISGFLPHWLGGEEALSTDSTAYFRIYICSLPFLCLNALAGGMLQCSGNMKIPSLLNSIMCILDVIFNGWLIYRMDMGVTGAALGTALSEAVIALFMLYFLLFDSPFLAIFPKERGSESDESVGSLRTKEAFESPKKRTTFPYIKKAIRIFLPITFERIIMSAAYIASTKIIAPLGIIAIAAHSFAITAESLCYMPGYGISEASTTLIGQSIGARRKDLAYSFGKLTIGFGMLIMALTGGLMYLFAPQMIAILTPDPYVQELAVRILRIEALAEPLYGASIVTAGVLRGAEDTLLPSLMNFISMWGVRIPFSYVLSRQFGLPGVWIAMCGELWFRGSIFLIRFFRKKWITS